METNTDFWLYLAQFFLELEIVSDKSFRESQNTNFKLNIFF
jgi:hypothetical protein